MRLCLLLPGLLLVTGFFNGVIAQTQVNAVGEAVIIKLPNGMNSVLQVQNNQPAVELTLTVKAGSVFDADSFSGTAAVVQKIIANKIGLFLQKNRSAPSFSGTTFVSMPGSERAIYKLTCTEANIAPALALFRDSVYNSIITQREIDKAVEQLRMETDSAMHNSNAVFNAEVMQQIFRRDYAKINPLGDTATYRFINAGIVGNFTTRYYTPNNSTLAVSGKVGVQTFQGLLETAFNPLIKSQFDPETITKIIDFRPMLYNIQYIGINDSVTAPEFIIYWQFPGTTANQHSSYYAWVLAAMLNDRNNYLQVKAAKMGCRKLVARYEPNNFSGVFKIVLQPDRQKLIETYEWLMDEMDRVEKTLANESMVNVGKILFNREFESIKQSKDYADYIARYWPYKYEKYFTDLSDSVMQTEHESMKRFIREYIVQSPHISALRISAADRNSLNIDSNFTNLSPSVADYVFTYAQNITDLEGADNHLKMRNLLQWLRANHDINIQVNGFADEGEFNKVYDDTIMVFIDSTPTFAKTMPDIIKKRYLRPESMRAMKILKYLYDNGIEADRLSGTSMLFHSSSKEEAEANMKCTITLTKLRISMSSYEYHYGRKRNE